MPSMPTMAGCHSLTCGWNWANTLPSSPSTLRTLSRTPGEATQKASVSEPAVVLVAAKYPSTPDWIICSIQLRHRLMTQNLFLFLLALKVVGHASNNVLHRTESTFGARQTHVLSESKIIFVAQWNDIKSQWHDYKIVLSEGWANKWIWNWSEVWWVQIDCEHCNFRSLCVLA